MQKSKPQHLLETARAAKTPSIERHFVLAADLTSSAFFVP